MKRRSILLGASVAAFLAVSAGNAKAAEPAPADKGGGVFPNDFGPKEIDVSKYPKEMQASYKLFTAKCSACHTIARPINTQFLELNADEIKKAKAEEPELFKDKNVVNPEEKIWSRYVKRMMAKPGCPVGKDGKKIYEFLAYDSKVRKTGAHWPAWQKNRQKLLKDFAAQNPERYKELFGVGGEGGRSGGGGR